MANKSQFKSNRLELAQANSYVRQFLFRLRRSYWDSKFLEVIQAPTSINNWNQDLMQLYKACPEGVRQSEWHGSGCMGRHIHIRQIIEGMVYTEYGG